MAADELWWRISPRSLSWAEVDPARHPFDAALAYDVVCALARPVPAAPHWVGRRLVGRRSGERWRDALSHALVERYGRWACGWCWGTGEGDHDGGPIGGWCCVSHSITSAEQTLALVADSLVEWRQWLEDLADRFDQVLPTLDPRQPPADLVAAWEIAVAQLVVTIADRTQGESGWYHHCAQVLSWLLTTAGIDEKDRPGLIEDAIGGRFHSWNEPWPSDVSHVAERLAHLVVAEPVVAEPAQQAPGDDLSAWLSVREGIDWRAVAGPVSAPARGDRDAIAEYAQRRETDSGPLLAALDQVRHTATAGGPLTFALLARWQRTVLGVDEAPFRTGAARAKLGRERYAWWPGLSGRFEECLAEATATDVPLPARAARVYLDVGFFHPFDDGNARSAMLALYFVLARDDVVLDHAAPVVRIARVAHDAVGAAGLAGLIEVLIDSTRRRMRH